MPRSHQRIITRDTVRPLSWHRHVTEHMVRSFFEDRHLGHLLGSASFFEYNDTHFVEFDYNQPLPLESRGVDWLDSTEDKVIFAGHGTYWETAPQIMATGCFTSSDHDNTYGDRMFFHNQTGVYVSSELDTWAIRSLDTGPSRQFVTWARGFLGTPTLRYKMLTLGLQGISTL